MPVTTMARPGLSCATHTLVKFRDNPGLANRGLDGAAMFYLARIQHLGVTYGGILYGREMFAFID